MFYYISAFGAGFLSFFTPCVLPLLPAYLSMLSGVSAKELLDGDGNAAVKRTVSHALVFAAGFSLAFSALGAAASAAGTLLAAYKGVLLRIFGAAMVLMGLHLAGGLNLKFLDREKRFSARAIKPGYIGSFLMGAAFALGWSPCIGPVLAGILMLAATERTAKGISLLFAYSAGLAVPFIAAAFLTARFFRWTADHKNFLRNASKIAGAALILFGILLFFNKLMFTD